jgi:hypothetical protein
LNSFRTVSHDVRGESPDHVELVRRAPSDHHSITIKRDQ